MSLGGTGGWKVKYAPIHAQMDAVNAVDFLQTPFTGAHSTSSYWYSAVLTMYSSTGVTMTAEGDHLDYAETTRNRERMLIHWTRGYTCDKEAVKNSTDMVNWLGAYRS